MMAGFRIDLLLSDDLFIGTRRSSDEDSTIRSYKFADDTLRCAGSRWDCGNRDFVSRLQRFFGQATGAGGADRTQFTNPPNHFPTLVPNIPKNQNMRIPPSELRNSPFHQYGFIGCFKARLTVVRRKDAAKQRKHDHYCKCCNRKHSLSSHWTSCIRHKHSSLWRM